MHLFLLALMLQSAPAQPQLTQTESIALQAIVDNFKKEISAVNEDVKKSHPGYQLDGNTLHLVPISAGPTQGQQPAKEPAKK